MSLGPFSKRSGTEAHDLKQTDAMGTTLRKKETTSLGRILVVADDADNLSSLREAFEEANIGWEIHLAGTEIEALSALDTVPFEVVIAELALGPLATTQFLNEVWQKCPKTARFLVGTGMQADIMVECAIGAHQFLEKPIEPESVKQLLARTHSINQLIQNPNVKMLVSRMRTLPSRPSVSMEVMKELRSNSASAQVVGELIAKDLAISSKLIQVVNSAYYGWAREVSEPGDAVMLLGLEATASLVLSIESFARFDKIKPLYFSIDEVWRHSQRIAQHSKTIAETISGDPTLIKDAFTAGLLHDIGKLALALNFEEEYRNAIGLAQTKNLTTCQAEIEVFGACHPEAGAYLLSIWGLPITIIEAVASHHKCANRMSTPFSAATAVHLAEALEYEEELKHRGNATIQVDLDYTLELNLQPQMEILRQVVKGSAANQKTKVAIPQPTVAVTPAPAYPQVIIPPRPGKFLPILAIAASLIGLLLTIAFFAMPNPNTVEPLGVAHVGGKPALLLQTTATETVHSQPTAPPEISNESFPPLKLQAVMFDEHNPQVRINGRSLHLGDEIQGVHITAISPDSVTVERLGLMKKIEMR
jgi:putative nucleotidyltransferase with HDIG domain